MTGAGWLLGASGVGGVRAGGEMRMAEVLSWGGDAGGVALLREMTWRWTTGEGSISTLPKLALRSAGAAGAGGAGAGSAGGCGVGVRGGP